MRADFKQESFAEGCFNRIFKGLSFKGIGLELTRVKEIVEVEQIENYKKPLLMFLLENDSILHIEIINDEIKPDLQSMLVYDMSIVLRYGIRVKGVILNFGNRQVGKMQKNFGSVHYNAKIVDLSGIDGEKVQEELSQKITSGCLLNERDKLNLVFLAFMQHSLPFNEVLLKVMYLIEKMKVEEERTAYLTVLSEIVTRATKQGLNALEEWLVDSEVGMRIKDVGVKEGMQNSLLIVLLHKFDSLPDHLHHAIANQQNESILMEWLRKALCINTIDKLEKMVFSVNKIKE
jgi:hypothetical protein